MVAIAMSQKDRKSTLKVGKPEQELIGLVAKHRDLSIEELFREKDVQSFFRHLLAAEMEKTGQRLKARN